MFLVLSKLFNFLHFSTFGLFNKGPVNEVVRITSTDQLVKKFGRPDDNTYKYFFPISTMLDQAPVNVVRVEQSDETCAGLTVATSGGETVGIETPVEVLAYPLTYESVFQPDDQAVPVTQIEFTGGEENTITFAGTGPGQYYNQVKVAVVNKADYDLLRDLQLSLAEAITPTDVQIVGQTAYNLAISGSGGLTESLAADLIDPSNAYDIDVEALEGYLFFENGPAADDEFGVYEYEGDSLVNAYLVSTDPEKKDIFAKSMFANKVINESSENIRVFVGTSKLTAAAVEPQTLPKTALSGASDISGTTEADVADEIYIQLNELFLNKEEISFTAFVDLDFPLAIKQRMDQICQIRMDCIALLNVDASKMINLTTGQKVAGATTAIKNWVDNDLNINSSYSGLYANYFQVYDPYNDENRWIPCTGHVANRMAFTFAQFEPWYAFAGLERGIISGVLKVAFNPDDPKRKVLYPARVNCIVDFRGEGVVIWGQKTLLATPSSLDRLNVRNLFIYIEKALERFSRFTLFKQNDGFTRAEWRAAVNPFMESVYQRRGVLEYLIVCDESNNTPEVVARNEFQAYVLVRPTPVVEFIKIVVADVGGTLSLQEAVQGVQI
jgi:hypothetical protein